MTRIFIAVVDDDVSVREALPDLLREFGYEAEGFSSAEEFLVSDRLKQTDCLVLDIAMPGMSGLDLQREVTRRERKFPIIFMTAHGAAPARLNFCRSAAVQCLLKPFSDTLLLAALQAVFCSK